MKANREKRMVVEGGGRVGRERAGRRVGREGMRGEETGEGR